MDTGIEETKVNLDSSPSDVAMESSAAFDIPERFNDAIDICGNKQVLKRIITEGTGIGRPTDKTTATIHYTGTLTDGSKFDSSVDRNEPFSTPVGAGRVIRGWDEVMPTMAKGEKAEVLIQSEYGYGAQGSPPNIPGGAALIFEMEMLSWSGEDISEDNSQSLTKITLTHGAEDDWVNPQEPDTVTLNIKIEPDINLENFTYTLGEEELYKDKKIPPGVRNCVEKMKVNETSEFTFKQNTKYNPLMQEITATISLLELQKTKKDYEMTDDQKLEAVEELRPRAAELYKTEFFEAAANKYNYMLKLLDFTPKNEEGEEYTTWKKLKISTFLNLSLVATKTKNVYDVIRKCDSVLDLDEKNEKALYRKSDCLFKLKEFDEAAVAYKLCLATNPENKAAKRGLALSMKAKKEFMDAEKKKYAKMFA